MVTPLKQAPLNTLQMMVLVAGSALLNGAIIASVLLVLDGGTLQLIEGGLIANLMAIYAMAFLFSWLFLRSEQRKASFEELALNKENIIIKRRTKTETIPIEVLVFIHGDQHFYRLIKRHRITFMHRTNGRRRISTVLLTKDQRDSLYHSIQGSVFEDFSRLKPPKP